MEVDCDWTMLELGFVTKPVMGWTGCECNGKWTDELRILIL